MSEQPKDAVPGGKVTFVEYHHPGLTAGLYEIRAKQRLVTSRQEPHSHEFQAGHSFAVLGPRFSLAPDVIQTVFPPAGSLGEHSSVLPHVTFRRSTLPWERLMEVETGETMEDGTKEKKKAPWLALLLFDESELPVIKPGEAAGSASHNADKAPRVLQPGPVTVGELRKLASNEGDVRFPTGRLKPGVGEHESDQVTVIDVEWSLLRQLLPNPQDLPWLAHVRHASDDRAQSDERVTVLCNRLPKPGSQSTVHLVSLEGHYTENAVYWESEGLNEHDKVRLVSLMSWRFACIEEKHSFKGLLHHLNLELVCEVDDDLVAELPDTTDDKKLPKIQERINRELVPQSPAQVRAYRQEVWQISYGKGGRLHVRSEGKELQVYEGAKRLCALARDPGASPLEAVRVALPGRFGEDATIEPHAQEVWQVTDAEGRLFSVRNEGGLFRFYRGAKLLCGIDSKSKLPESSVELKGTSLHEFAQQGIELGETSRLESLTDGTWRVTDVAGKRILIRREGSRYQVYDGSERLFSLTPEGGRELPGLAVDLDKGVLDELKNKLSIKTLTGRADRELWRIEDPGNGEDPGNENRRYRVRREGERYRAFRGALHLFDVKNGGVLAPVDTDKILPSLHDEFRSKGQIELLPGATIRKAAATSWRLEDGTGLWFAVRSEGGKEKLYRHTSGMLRLPSGHLTESKSYVDRGYVPSEHHMRHGGRTVSWYRGPLSPVAPVQPTVRLPARTSDELVRYDRGSGMFDVSYAAAWQLGRMMTLQNGPVALSLFDWKRRHRRARERADAMRQLEHLHIEGQAVSADIPRIVSDWFHDLSLLKGVPFNYLVPDERMLPKESMRFFWLDPVWVRCLLDGALSIGRVLVSDNLGKEPDHEAPLPATVTGFLLRSEVVSGWPDLQVDGYDKRVTHENYEQPVQPPSRAGIKGIDADAEGTIRRALDTNQRDMIIDKFGFPVKRRAAESADSFPFSDIEVTRLAAGNSWLVNLDHNRELYLIKEVNGRFEVMLENRLPTPRPPERLSPNVLICLFAGDIMTVDIHQKPEALHFGLNRNGDEALLYYREMKDIKGGETTMKIASSEMPWRDKGALRVLNVEQLATKMKESVTTEFTSAQFALQMAEGVQKVRFASELKSS